MGQSTTPKALALGVSLSLACGLLPSAAFADETPADSNASGSADAAPTGDAAKPAGYDKADFYSDNASATIARSLAAPLSLSSFAPVSLSPNMKYFARYESSQNYDQELSWGDGYHAMGYYQFDNRYTLKNFLVACYNYDSTKYAMFGWVANIDISGNLYDSDAGKLTATGKQLNDSWHAAYANNPTEFAGLQDSYAYNNYYVPAENYLASRGIDISNRSDSLKGLCWGLANLFGTSGWHKFVGGNSDGYVNGTYYYSYNYPDAGLTNDMTDEEFVATLCDYVVAHVGEFYQGQPQYHEGWQNRYRAEKAQCLALLDAPEPEAPPVTVEPPATVEPAPPTVQPAPPTVNPAPPTDVEEPSNPGTTPPADTSKPEEIVPPASNKPEDTTPPIDDTDGSSNQGGSNEIVKPSEPSDTTDGKDETTAGDTKPPANVTSPGADANKNETTTEVADENKTTLEEPVATTQKIQELPKPESTNQASENTQGASVSKTSSLTQTGDDVPKGPLGAALVSAGVVAIAGAALVTRRILK